MNELAIIVGMDKNRGIGANNDLLWGRDLPADLSRFKKLTTGSSIIMGRKTFESIGSRPLPNRENIVVTSTPTGVDKVLSCASLDAALALARYKTFIIGGARIYEAALLKVDKLFVTEVDAVFSEATVFFPQINTAIWSDINREHHDSDEQNAYSFDFVTYERIGK